MNENGFLDKKVIDLFLQNGIEGIKDIKLSKYNLIVGENGSGKTRFLKTVEKTLLEDKNGKNVIFTLYYPEIGNLDFINENDGAKDHGYNENGTYLLDLVRGNTELACCDFLNTIRTSEDAYRFIISLFDFSKAQAPGERKKALGFINIYNDIFFQLANRRFVEKNGEYYVAKYAGEKVVREVALENAFSRIEMSPGELMLFYLTILISYLEVHSNQTVIVIIDEPEQHLHPEKQLALINWLKKSSAISQLWIATHSVFFLPRFNFEEIILLDNSVIVPRSSQLYFYAFEKLIGAINIDELSFIDSIDSWQYNQYISECFLLPEVKDTPIQKDEQVSFVLNILRDRQKKKPLKVLDFGAGKARLWECLKLAVPDKKERDKLVSYTAYEPNVDKKHHYDESIIVVDNPKTLRLNVGSFDIIILMNVLHEIPVFSWVENFKLIYDMLNDGGCLILVETRRLIKGELPNQYNGYILLGNREIQYLVGSAGQIDFQEGQKSNAWVIEKTNLEGISQDKVYQTLDTLLRSTYEILLNEFTKKLNVYKGDPDKAMNARTYAFYSQQYINVLFARNLYTQKNK